MTEGDVALNNPWADPILMKKMPTMFEKVALAKVTSGDDSDVEFWPPNNAFIANNPDTEQKASNLLLNLTSRGISDLPEEYFPNFDILTTVGSQGNCGCCWCWSTVTTLADRYAFVSGEKAPNLSIYNVLACAQQQVGFSAATQSDCYTDVECGTDVGFNSGCNGDSPSTANAYLTVFGTVEESCVSAKNSEIGSATNDSMQNQCSDSSCMISNDGCSLYKASPNCIASMTGKNSDIITVLKTAIYGAGSVVGTYQVPASQQAVPKSGVTYQDLDTSTLRRILGLDSDSSIGKGGGIYNAGDGIDATGEGEENEILGGHAITIVGWGVQKDYTVGSDNIYDSAGSSSVDLPYWICRNSWGTGWPGLKYDDIPDGYWKHAMEPSDGTLYNDGPDSSRVGNQIACVACPVNCSENFSQYCSVLVSGITVGGAFILYADSNPSGSLPISPYTSGPSPSPSDEAKSWWNNNKKWVIVVLVIVLAIIIISSIWGAIMRSKT
jgi:hypothetical protein